MGRNAKIGVTIGLVVLTGLLRWAPSREWLLSPSPWWVSVPICAFIGYRIGRAHEQKARAAAEALEELPPEFIANQERLANEVRLADALAAIQPSPPREGDARLHAIIDRYLVLRKGLPNGGWFDQELALRWPDVEGIVLVRACSVVAREELVRELLLDMLREAVGAPGNDPAKEAA